MSKKCHQHFLLVAAGDNWLDIQGPPWRHSTCLEIGQLPRWHLGLVFLSAASFVRQQLGSDFCFGGYCLLQNSLPSFLAQDQKFLRIKGNKSCVLQRRKEGIQVPFGIYQSSLMRNRVGIQAVLPCLLFCGSSLSFWVISICEEADRLSWNNLLFRFSSDFFASDLFSLCLCQQCWQVTVLVGCYFP